MASTNGSDKQEARSLVKKLAIWNHMYTEDAHKHDRDLYVGFGRCKADLCVEAKKWLGHETGFFDADANE